jgi:phosphatidylglycerophosphatase A
LERRALLWVAQGFGAGAYLPAPGTWGSVLGVALFVALAWPGNILFYGVGSLALILAAVPVCTAAENALGRKDPGSVVLDEIVAMPLCYSGWVLHAWISTGRCSSETLLSQPHAWLILGAGFVAFRCLDIIKPWSIRAVQSMPGGWGVVLDDILAAVLTVPIVHLLILFL